MTSTGRISVAARVVWAIRVSASVGHSVRQDLRNRWRVEGPIVSHPRSATWSFLVEPDVPLSPSLIGPLFRANVAVHRDGAEIALPSPADRPFTARHWVVAPRDKFRPSGSVVLAAISRCLPGRGIDLRLIDTEWRGA
ncbi:DNA-directed RNA polymerase subunit beta [Nocardia donostiensis]|uniref:DNA-directed RNA polymerase subunit beta n=1 Tax=Nocardia donostiensis TaxID=1538463 RepID=UPI001FE2ECE4|nr:DNA-directed RNA polymerase subunit beta [Nocardia donostiensis]